MPRLPRTLRLILLGGVTLAIVGAIALAIVLATLSARLPDVQTLRTTELQEPLYVYARDGRLMGLFGEMRRYPVDIEDVPERVLDLAELMLGDGRAQGSGLRAHGSGQGTDGSGGSLGSDSSDRSPEP